MIRWRLVVLLAPTLTVIVGLFGGGLVYGLLQSLGWQPALDRTDLSLAAYHHILFGEQYAEQFWRGLLLSLWISLASTVISAVLAVGLALLLRGRFRGKRFATFLLQFNLPVPHLVAALGLLFLLSQSGLVARFAAQFGWLTTPADFPILVRDGAGLGIIVTYIWKEVPFIAVILLAVLQALDEDYENLARSLGANRWQRFRYVTLPLILPALLSASMLVLAFTFGAYEVPELLGVRFPRALPVTALRFFIDNDLNARDEAMAMSMIISAVALVFLLLYLRFSWQRGALDARR